MYVVVVLNVPVQPHLPAIDVDVMVESKNPVIAAYKTSIRRARDIITCQWRECSWAKKNMNIEQPVSEDEVNTILFIPIIYVLIRVI